MLVSAQEMLVSRSSDTLKALAELDAAELRRHRQNTLLWEVSTFCDETQSGCTWYSSAEAGSLSRAYSSWMVWSGASDRAPRQAEVFHAC